MCSQQTSNTSLYTLLQSSRVAAHSSGQSLTPGKSQDRITRYAQANCYQPIHAPVSFLDSRSRSKPSSKPNSLKAANNLAVSAASLDTQQQPLCQLTAASRPAAESSLGSLELLSNRLQDMMSERRDELNREAAFLLKCQVSSAAEKAGDADRVDDLPVPPPRRQSAAGHRQQQQQQSDSARLSRSRSADDTLNLSDDDNEPELTECVSNDCVLDSGDRPKGAEDASPALNKQPSGSSASKKLTFGFLSRFRSGQHNRQDAAAASSTSSAATDSPKKSHSSRFPSFRKLLRMPKKIKKSPIQDNNKSALTAGNGDAGSVAGAAQAHSNGLTSPTTNANSSVDSPSSSAYFTANSPAVEEQLSGPSSAAGPVASPDSALVNPALNDGTEHPVGGEVACATKPQLRGPIVTVTMETDCAERLRSENLPNELLAPSSNEAPTAAVAIAVSPDASAAASDLDEPANSTNEHYAEAVESLAPLPAPSPNANKDADVADEVPVTLRANRSGGSPSGAKLPAGASAAAAPVQLLPLPVGTSTPNRVSPGRGRLAGYNRRKTKSCTECEVQSGGAGDNSAQDATDLLAAVVSASASNSADAAAAATTAASLIADAKARERSSLIMISAAMRGAAILAAGMTRSLNFDALHAAEPGGEDADAGGDAEAQSNSGSGGEKCAGRYFLMLADREEKKIRVETDWIEAVLNDADRPDLSEEVAGIFRVGVGKAKLFLSEKLAQFRGLCEDNLAGGVTQYCDLNGFWAICGLQIDDLTKLLSQCRTIRDAGFVVAMATSDQADSETKASSLPTKPQPQQQRKAPSSKRSAAAKKAVTSGGGGGDKEGERQRRERLAEMKREARKKMMAAAAASDKNGGDDVIFM